VFSIGTTIVIYVLTVLLAVIPWHLFNNYWLKPKRFEKLLKAQGFQGEPYNLSVLKDKSKQNYMLKLQQEDKSKSIGLSKEAAPSIFTPFHQTVQKYGTSINLTFYLFIYQLHCWLTFETSILKRKTTFSLGDG